MYRENSLKPGAMFWALCLILCGGVFISNLAVGAEPTVDSVNASDSQSAADKAWTILTSSGPRPERLLGESNLAYFLREVELSDLRRRELGLKFWDTYPDDPRRYSWFQLTVHMPPHYPLDIKAWAEQETDHMSVNNTPIDIAKKRKWDKRYPELRAAFFAAKSVTANNQRFFWFGELKQDLEQLRQAHALGKTVDTAPFLESYADFIKSYSVSFSENDAGKTGKEKFWEYNYYHKRMLQSLWKDVFEQGRELFSWTPESARAFFIDGMAPSLKGDGVMSVLINKLRDHLAANGSLPPKRHDRIKTLSEKSIPWEKLRKHDRWANDSTPEAAIVSTYQFVIDGRKVREIGERLWRTHPDSAGKMNWLSDMGNRPLHYNYMTSFVDDIRLISAGRKSDIHVDLPAWEAGQKRLAVLRQEFLNDPNVHKSLKISLMKMEMARQARTFEGGRDQQGISTAPSAEEKAQYLGKIKSLYTDLDEVEVAAESMWGVVRFPRRYGLDDKALDDFIAVFRKSDNEEMQRAIALYDRRKAWKKSPVELTVPRFEDEGTFSLSDLKGKIVFIDTWSTWCGGCIAKMPKLHETYLDYKDKGFEFVSVVYDGTTEAKKVRRVLRDLDLTWPVVVGDNNEQADLIDNHFMILNRDGTVYEYFDSRLERSLRDVLEEMLAAEKSNSEAG